MKIFLNKGLNLFAYLAFLAIASSSVFGNPGSLDPNFGTGGKVITKIEGVLAGVKSIALQSDGKIVAIGGGNFLAVRYNSNGILDNSFGTGGILKLNIPNSSSSLSEALAIQTDGKIIIVGSSSDPNTLMYCTIARVNSNGDLDTAFGNQGTVKFRFSSHPESFQRVRAVALQTDGKIVLLAQSTNPGTSYILFRLNQNGVLDTSFGTNSVFTTPFSDFGFEAYRSNNLLVQPDNKILVGGIENGDLGVGGAIIRLNANGSLDSSFASAGFLSIKQAIVNTPFANFSWNSIALQPNGKILAAGINYRRIPFRASPPYVFYSNEQITLLRFNQNGSLDPTFAENGSLMLYSSKFGQSANVVVSGADNKIYVGGDFSVFQRKRYLPPSLFNFDFLVSGFNENGTLNTNWGDNGFAITDFGNNLSDTVTDLAIQADGKIVASGNNITNGSSSDFIIARYLAN